MFAIEPAVQYYAWGKLGIESEVASLASQAIPSMTVEDNLPYAEVIC